MRSSVLLLALGLCSATAAGATAKSAARMTPAHDPLVVAFLVTNGAQVIDVTGPWEVFQDAAVAHKPMFKLITVSDARDPVKLTGGLTVIPDYTFKDVPEADVVVVGAQGKFASDAGRDEAYAWLRAMHERAQVEMSVCVGAATLAEAGLLAGKKATTHHAAFAPFHQRFPDVELVPGKRYVQSDPTLFTSGGLTAGIDLALHIVARYFGNDVAQETAGFMEYKGSDWK